MYGINILICTTDFKTLCTIHQDIQDQAYTIPALLWVHSLMKHHNSETFQELTLQECIDLVVLLMCSDKSFLISQTICDAHLLHMYVSVPSVVLSLALLMKVLKLGNNVCDPILEVWLVNCRAQIQVLQLNFIGCIHCKICLFTSIYL